MFYEVIPKGKVETLTYHLDDSLPKDQNLAPGQIVMVPIGRRIVPGIISKKVTQPEFKTKPISKVLYKTPVPKQLMAAIHFMHDYYMAPSGEAVAMILPKGVEKKRRKTEQMFGNTVNSGESLVAGCSTGHKDLARAARSVPEGHAVAKLSSPSHIPLNPAQKKALQALQKAPGATKLLFGITGSGKTNIYLKMASTALQEQRSVILLVPEIALTGQLVQIFEHHFKGQVALIHSRQTEAERHLLFEQILNAKNPLIVIGPRSALFAPIHNLGLIIIDEEHESTYHQENTPRYSAIRMASFIAKTLKISLVLGSATPDISDFYIANKQNAVVELKEKAKTDAIKPNIKIIDLKDREQFKKNKYFSDALLLAIKKNLELKRQTLIFHNRRGSSPLTICENCGEEILCPHCFLPLTLHADNYELVCHTCGFKRNVPPSCPKCGSPGLVHKGFGTKLLENELKKLFPNAIIKRFDADNKKDETLDSNYLDIKDGKIDILIGTQVVAKGLDLPKLATVGIVQADAGLNLPDYMAEERVFQSLTQVIGRVGRGHLDTAEVYIQTFRPDHPTINLATSENYLDFFKYQAARRKQSGFPPFIFIAKLEITMKTETTTIRKIRETISKLSPNQNLIVSPPMPAFHERTKNGYTWQIIVRAKSRKALQEACINLDKSIKITFDPISLL